MFSIIIVDAIERGGKKEKNSMVIFDLTVEKQQIYGAEKIALAADANDTIAFRFHFDRNWRIFDSKAAIFKNSDGEFYIIEIKDSKATVPWEVLTHDRDVELSAIAFEGTNVLTSKCVTLTVSKSLLPEEYKTFSASETLFDRFKKECTASALLEYEDEIKQLKLSYEDTIAKLGVKIVEANQQEKAVEDEKAKEIAELKNQQAVEVKALNTKISDITDEYNAAKIKADKWDMIDYALKLKTSCTQQLWGSSSNKYSLPMLNTVNMTFFSSSYIDNNLTEIGFDLTSATKFEGVFSCKVNIRRVELKNTEKVVQFNNAFENCGALRELIIGNLTNCSSLYHFAPGAKCLEKVTFGEMPMVTVYDYMLSNCAALKEIVGEFDMSHAASLSNAFSGCSSLETIRFKPNTIVKSIDLRNSIVLSKESMMSLIYGLNDKAGASLYISQYAFENLFPTQKEQGDIYEIIMTQKGWAVGLY
jgi:hypothetical protein